MKKFSVISLMAVSALTSATSAFAYGEIERLQQDAHNLDYSSQSSYMNYDAKDAVSRFAVEVDGLANCERGGFNPGNCSYQLQGVEGTWNLVDQYLRDSEYSFPEVYRQYSEVKTALYDYLNYNTSPGPGPGPGPGPVDPGNPGFSRWFVNGQMDNSPFSFSDYSKNGIYQQCINFGRYGGINFVRNLTINGQRIFFAGNRLEPVCQLVADHALNR